MLSKYLFGNKTSLKSNILGRFRWKLANIVSGEEKQHEIEHGFIKLPLSVENELIEKINEEKEHALAENEKVIEQREDGEIIKKSIKSNKIDFEENMKSSLEVLDVLEEEIQKFYGCGFKPEYFNLIRYPAPENEEERENEKSTKAWHHDVFPPDHKRIFLLLSEASEKTGGTSKFISRNDTRKIMKEGYSPEATEELSEASLKEFKGSCGDVAIADPVNYLHRGTDPREGNRDMLIITVRPSPTPLPENWKESLEFEKTHSNLGGLSLMKTYFKEFYTRLTDYGKI